MLKPFQPPIKTFLSTKHFDPFLCCSNVPKVYLQLQPLRIHPHPLTHTFQLRRHAETSCPRPRRLAALEPAEQRRLVLLRHQAGATRQRARQQAQPGVHYSFQDHYLTHFPKKMLLTQLIIRYLYGKSFEVNIRLSLRCV